MGDTFASNNKGVGYSSKNDAIAGGLACAAAIKEQNPDVKISIAVGSEASINKTSENPPRIENEKNNSSNSISSGVQAAAVFGMGYETKNQAIAGALAGAAAMKEQNPDIKVSATVVKQGDLSHVTNVRINDNSKNGGNK